MRDSFAKCVVESVPKKDESKLKDSEYASLRCGKAISFHVFLWMESIRRRLEGSDLNAI